MNLAVVAFPILEARDSQRIESYRAEHDPQASLIALHFTLVFPFEASPDDVGPEIAMVAQSTVAFAFTVQRCDAVADAFGNGSHIFLVPDDGSSQITTLHDRLYAGTLKRHLRTDIPFVPHMTVAAAPDLASARRLANDFDVRAWTVRGTVESLELVDVGLPRVRRIRSYKLSSSNRIAAD